MPTQKELFDLASIGDAPALEEYLTAGFDINAVETTHNCTLLHYAASRKDTSMAERLLGNDPKPNIDALGTYGETPLHFAADGKQKNPLLMVALLLDHNATINITDVFNGTPLHNAIGSIETVTLLLNRGADIDAVNNSGTTALHLARNAKEAAHLLEHGANPFIQNGAGLTASKEQRRIAQVAQHVDFSSIPVIEAHMNWLVKQVTERKAAMSALLDPHLIPDLANMVNEYQDMGEVSIASLSKDPTKEPDPKTRAQLELQQLVLKDVLDSYAQTKKEEREKAASAAQATSSSSSSASSSSSSWSARISPRAASAAPSPSAPLDHAMRSTSPSSMER